MATRHRYEFECGHTALATNGFALAACVTITSDDCTLKCRACPRCVKAMARRLEQCMLSGRKSQDRKQISKLPDTQ